MRVLNSKNIITGMGIIGMHSTPVPPVGHDNDVCNPETLVDTVRTYVKWFLDTYKGLTERRQGVDWASMWGYVLSSVGKEAGFPYGREDYSAFPKAEETASLLLRSGIPRDAVRAGQNHVTISLDGALIRIYRITSGYPQGSFRILRPDNSRVIRTGLPSREFADLILSINSAAPDILKAMKELETGMDTADRKLIARLKAEEIERVTIKNLLDTALTPRGINYDFEVKDGAVSMTFKKTLSSDMTVPVDQLWEILADPDYIESTLKTELGNR